MQSNGGAVAAARGARAGHQHGRLGAHRRRRRLDRRSAAGSATATSSPPTSAAPRSSSGSSSTASPSATPRPSSTTTRSTSRRCGCTPSGPAAARSRGSTPAATCGSGRTARAPSPAPPPTTRAAPSRPTPTPTSSSASSRRRACSAGARRSRSSAHGRPSAPAIAEPLGPVRRGRRGGHPRRAERPDRRPAAQDRRRGRLRPPRLRPLRLRRLRPRVLRRVRAPTSASRRSSSRSGAVASAFSAYGLAASDIELAAGALRPRELPVDPVRAEKTFAQLEDQVRQGLDRQGLTFDSVEIVREIDMRYAMQLAEVTVPVTDGPLDAGRARRGRDPLRDPLRRALRPGLGLPRGRRPGHHLPRARPRHPAVLPGAPAARRGRRPRPRRRRDLASTGLPRRSAAGYEDTPIYDYAALRAGHRITGPAVIEVPTTTVVVPAGRTGTVDGLGNLTHPPDAASPEGA